MSTAPVTFRTFVPPLVVMWLWDNEADTPIFRELANERGILRFHMDGSHPCEPGDVVRYWRSLAYYRYNPWLHGPKVRVSVS